MGEDPAKAEPGRYRAFISYNHSDAKFAHWLHARLERWRLPDKSRLAPVFIDRAELAAGSDLSAQVREALAGSAALIVVCSPKARTSRWVGQEIALFRELHPDRPVLAALIEGEPGEAFPDELVRSDGKPLEPLAADFRKGHDGQRLGLLKLAAGLTALPLDRLVQRDAQARQRRVMAITAAAVLLVLILSAALVIALRARAEAERQRAEAEGLVEFMLTDLRDKLKSTGDPKIMAAVNQRALDYYSHMDVTKLPDESLDRRARVLHAMGEDNERLGNFTAAQKMYLEAWRITDEVLKRHPKDPDAIFAHAQSEFWVGEAAWQQGDLDTTGVHWRGYLVQAMSLSRVEPESKRSLMELSYAHGNLCEWTVRTKPDQLPAGLRQCERASVQLRKLSASSPTDKGVSLALANRIGWQADVLFRLGRYDEAIALRREEQALVEHLVAQDPGNFELRERSLWPLLGIADAESGAGRLADAIAILIPCLDKYDRLAAQHPDHKGIVEQQFRAAILLAIDSRKVGFDRAAEYSARAHELFNMLSKTRPTNQMGRFEKMLASIENGRPK